MTAKERGDPGYTAAGAAAARWPLRLVKLALQAAAVAAVAALLALLAWRIAADPAGGGFTRSIRDGKKPPAPAFALPVIWDRAETWPVAFRRALGDGTVALSELRGRPAVLNFWASWCIPCKREAPALAAAARKYKGSVVFLGIDVQDFTQDARRFLARVDAPYVSVRDKGPDTYTAYGLTGVPETYYLDARGRAVAHSIGEIGLDDLEAGIATALASSS